MTSVIDSVRQSTQLRANTVAEPKEERGTVQVQVRDLYINAMPK
jgi:hypothetical protein